MNYFVDLTLTAEASSEIELCTSVESTSDRFRHLDVIIRSDRCDAEDFIALTTHISVVKVTVHSNEISSLLSHV